MEYGMKLKVAVVASLVFALLAFAACAQQAPSGSSSSASSSASGSSAAAASASSSATAAAEAVNVMALNGPTGIGMAKLSQDKAYDVRFVGSTDEVVSAVSSGSVDIAAVPTNLAATLYNKTSGSVKLLAVDTYGTLYLLGNGASIASLGDLAGQHIYATGMGANPQYIFEYLIRQAGMDPNSDMQIEYLPEHSELAALVATGEAGIALLPEPFVSVAKAKGGDSVQVALDIGEQWKATTGSDLAMGGVIVRAEFAEQHPQLVEKFLEDLAASTAYANDNVSEAAQLCADLGILPNAEIAKTAIPQCSLVCVTGEEAKGMVDSYLGVLYDSNPNSVGGSLPDAEFYL